MGNQHFTALYSNLICYETETCPTHSQFTTQYDQKNFCNTMFNFFQYIQLISSEIICVLTQVTGKVHFLVERLTEKVHQAQGEITKVLVMTIVHLWGNFYSQITFCSIDAHMFALLRKGNGNSWPSNMNVQHA